MASDTTQQGSIPQRPAPRPKLSTELPRPTSGEQVIIGCKLPHGIVLEHITIRPEPADGRTVNFNPAPAGPRVVLNGSNSMLRPGLVMAQGEHLFGMTHVDRSFWEKWLEHNRGSGLVQKGFVFEVPGEGSATKARDTAVEMAKERADLRTGLEALDPRTDDKGKPVDPRMRKNIIPGQSETVVTSDPERLELLNRMTGGRL